MVKRIIFNLTAMKTYLVPIDFSDAALNAARFAAELSKQTNAEHIILMNAYYISPYETMLPDTNLMMLREQEIEENVTDRINQLEKLKKKLQREVRSGVQIHTRLMRSHLLRAVVDTVMTDQVDMVFMGSKGNSTAGQPGIGSHVVKVSKASPAPVMVIPPGYHYQLIDKAVIACDFIQIKESLPIATLHKLLGEQAIQLLVVNVDNDGKHANANPRQLAEETALHGMLESFYPQYYYIHSPSIISGILNFAGEHQARMVIALQHRYSFLRSLVHSSISGQLASTSAVPVLLLK
jgi:nucleotide-binding universal stress UspA family protein